MPPFLACFYLLFSCSDICAQRNHWRLNLNPSWWRDGSSAQCLYSPGSLPCSCLQQHRPSSHSSIHNQPSSLHPSAFIPASLHPKTFIHSFLILHPFVLRLTFHASSFIQTFHSSFAINYSKSSSLLVWSLLVFKLYQSTLSCWNVFFFCLFQGLFMTHTYILNKHSSQGKALSSNNSTAFFLLLMCVHKKEISL